MLKYKNESSFNDFQNELLLKCQMHNAYLNANDLLPYNEIKAKKSELNNIPTESEQRDTNSINKIF